MNSSVHCQKSNLIYDGRSIFKYQTIVFEHVKFTSFEGHRKIIFCSKQQSCSKINFGDITNTTSIVAKKFKLHNSYKTAISGVFHKFFKQSVIGFLALKIQIKKKPYKRRLLEVKDTLHPCMLGVSLFLSL